ncbi:EFR1 family ferrodoxin [Bacteroides fragilis]|nr:EFR1 family ferrodoxin [Bacteroides fragilis]
MNNKNKMINDKEMSIYYFSGTGNSLKLSLDIASNFSNVKLFKIEPTTKVAQSNSQMVGFIFPVYMGGLPNIVREFLENYSFEKGIYYFSIGTYYAYKGCAMSIVNKIMSDNGVYLNYGNYLPSVGNCLKEYEVSQKKRVKILKQAEIYTQDIINDLKKGKEKKHLQYCGLSDRLHKTLFNMLFSRSHLKFTLENNCLSCRICEKICPVNNITLKDGVPQWGENCEACHACVHWCPQNAIHIGKSKGRLQYHNPAIKKTMLFNTKRTDILSSPNFIK